MERFFKWKDYQVDKMSHECDVISTDFKISSYNIKGKPDRRFKTGWRIKPSSGNCIIINFKLKRNDRFHIGQMWSIGEKGIFGTHIIIGLGLEHVDLIPVSISQNNNLSNFSIPNKINMAYLGATIGEGSV